MGTVWESRGSGYSGTTPGFDPWTSKFNSSAMLCKNGAWLFSLRAFGNFKPYIFSCSLSAAGKTPAGKTIKTELHCKKNFPLDGQISRAKLSPSLI